MPPRSLGGRVSQARNQLEAGSTACWFLVWLVDPEDGYNIPVKWLDFQWSAWHLPEGRILHSDHLIETDLTHLILAQQLRGTFLRQN
jgi:hypothetical protein